MQITQPSLCARCLALFSLQMDSDVASCRIEAWWCPHSGALAICVVDGDEISQMTVQAPLTDGEALDRIRELKAGAPVTDEGVGAGLRQ